MSKIIDPRTNKPFSPAQVSPSQEIVRLRQMIMSTFQMKYDAAQSTSQNELHWSQSDNLSPNAANSLPVRKKLRSRSRYETQNNGYLLGILLSISNDTIGSGPTLKITDPRFTDEQKRAIERRWLQRSKKTKLRRKLWRMNFGKIQDGEAFSFAYTDRRQNFRHPVKINQRVFEPDQVSHFEFSIEKKEQNTEVDGIQFDPASGEPSNYHLLNEHPGETLNFGVNPTKGEWFPENQVIHWYRQQRGWLRGIPETTATLPLWALLRRYTLAVVQNAEIAADFTVLLKSMQLPSTNPFSLDGSGEPTEESPEDWFDSFPIDRGLMTVLPSMYEMDQLDPKQPVNMYDSFVRSLVQEAARPLLTPINVSTANSSNHNMSAGTIDRQLYRGAIDQNRIDCGEEVLDKDLEQWWFEAIRVPNYFEDGVSSSDVTSVVKKFQSLREDPPEHTYLWDEVPEHSDPVKVASAMEILHQGGHISDTDIQEGRFNRSTEEHYGNLAKQKAWREENGFDMDFVEVPEMDDDDEI